MKQDRPSSKAKIWFLKSLAFFIALIVFTIARVIFTALNGGTMDGKLEIGGILLFYGVYALLSGLFLNDSSAKKRGGWILLIYIIVSIALTYYLNNSKFGLENQIMRMNQNTPTRIDDQTELLSAKLNGNNVDIKYRLFNYVSSDIPSESIHQLKSQIKQEFCKDSDYQKIMKYKSGINVYVYGKHGSQIIDLYLTQEICSIRDDNHKTPTELEKENLVAEKNLKIENDIDTKKKIHIQSNLAVVHTQNHVFVFDGFGRISQLILKDKQIDLLKEMNLKPLEVRYFDQNINADAFTINAQASKKEIDATISAKQLTITQKLTKTVITKIFSFYPDGHYELEIRSSNNAKYFITPGKFSDGNAKILFSKSNKDSIESYVGVELVADFNNRYISALYSSHETFSASTIKNRNDSDIIFIHSSDTIQLIGYIGEIDKSNLKNIDENSTYYYN